MMEKSHEARNGNSNVFRATRALLVATAGGGGGGVNIPFIHSAKALEEYVGLSLSLSPSLLWFRLSKAS